MGNSTSSSSGSGSGSSNTSSSGEGSRPGLAHTLSFKRSTGSLGLSRSELDKRCRPSGLYPACEWEERTIRRLVGDGKLAARVRGTDERLKPTDVECPICFLNYSEVNATKCCSAFICTECFLQMEPPLGRKPDGGGSSKRHRTCSSDSCCPFCNATRLVVQVPTCDVNLSKIAERDEEEQRTIEAKIRASIASEAASTADADSSADNDNDAAGTATATATVPPAAAAAAAAAAATDASTFGASLERHASFRKVSEDYTSETHAAGSGGDLAAAAEFVSLASVEERRRLEDEMKRQHLHPLARRMQQEAEAASNARASAAAAAARQRRSSGSRVSRRFRDRIGGSGGTGRHRDWNQIVEAFESDGHSEIQSLDDLVVIEAAILLSMEEAARQQEEQGDGTRSDAAADFNAARQVRSGFPLLQALMARNGDQSDEEERGEHDADQSVGGPSEHVRPPRSSMSLPASGARASRRRLRTGMGRSIARDTAGMLVRGMSEEEQVAMAIAMSLREPQPEASGGGGGGGGSDGGGGQQQESNETNVGAEEETDTGETLDGYNEAGSASASSVDSSNVVERTDTGRGTGSEDEQPQRLDGSSNASSAGIHFLRNVQPGAATSEE